MMRNVKSGPHQHLPDYHQVKQRSDDNSATDKFGKSPRHAGETFAQDFMVTTNSGPIVPAKANFITLFNQNIPIAGSLCKPLY